VYAGPVSPSQWIFAVPMFTLLRDSFGWRVTSSRKPVPITVAAAALAGTDLGSVSVIVSGTSSMSSGTSVASQKNSMSMSPALYPSPGIDLSAPVSAMPVMSSAWRVFLPSPNSRYVAVKAEVPKAIVASAPVSALASGMIDSWCLS